jgi:hypothetical protein
MVNQYVILAVYLALCFFIAVVGRKRKWGFWGYLWSSMLFSPLLGLIFLFASDPKENR